MGGTVLNLCALPGTTDINSGVGWFPEPAIIRAKLSFKDGAITALTTAGVLMHQDVSGTKAPNGTIDATDFEHRDNPWFNWWQRADAVTTAKDAANCGVLITNPQSQSDEDPANPQIVKICVAGIVQCNCADAVEKGDLLTQGAGELVTAVVTANVPVLILGRALEDAVAADADTDLSNTWVHLEGLYGFGMNDVTR